MLSCAVIETCEGTVCRDCRVNILHCRCSHVRMDFLARDAMGEQISAQGLVPQTETPAQAREAA